MTRKREWYKGSTYHITVRGNRRNDIFRDKEDFEYYLNVIEEALFYYIQYNYKVICYCLMDNHVHLMIKTDTESLGKLMGRISASYTRYFNKKYNYIGHLFQDRYFGELIESDKQMLEASRYIHLNPVKANMVEKLTEVISFLEGVNPYSNLEDLKCDNVIQRPYLYDFEDVQGQDAIIEFIVATAAGGHNLIMSGAPGCGKSMIAKRIPSILTSMTEKEALEVTKIYSVSGGLKNRGSLITERPFRAPHHNASINSLAGGGNNAIVQIMKF